MPRSTSALFIKTGFIILQCFWVTIGTAGDTQNYAAQRLNSNSYDYVAVKGGKKTGHAARHFNGSVVVDVDNNRIDDAILESNATKSRSINNVTPGLDAGVSNFAETIPNIKGYGKIPDLHTSLAMNASFLLETQQLLESNSIQKIQENFDGFLYSWAGTHDYSVSDLNPTSTVRAIDRKIHFETDFWVNLPDVTMDIRQLGLLKQYSGLDELGLDNGVWQDGDELRSTGLSYQSALESIRNNIFLKMAVGSGLLSDFIPELDYSEEKDTIILTKNVSSRKIRNLLDRSFAEDSTDEDRARLDTALNAMIAMSKRSGRLVASVVSAHWAKRGDELLAETQEREFLIRLVQKSGYKIIEPSSREKSLNLQGNNFFALGSKEADLITGIEDNNIIFGGMGDDIFLSAGDNNVLRGGDDDDTINTNGHANIAYGNNGNDIITLWGSGGHLYGGNGDDELNHGLLSDQPDQTGNTIDGGAGNDTIKSLSENGNDTYIFNRKSGKDTIIDSGGTDTLKFGVGIDAGSLKVSYSGKDLLIAIYRRGKPTGDSILLQGAFSERNRIIEHLTFHDGYSLSGNNLYHVVLHVKGDAGNNTLVGTAAPEGDYLRGLGGDDILDASFPPGGDDALFGGDGNDTLIAHAQSNNTLYGEAGDDTITLHGNSGSAYGEYQNIFIGGQGNDSLTGLLGSDVYMFHRGDGQDRISDFGGEDTLAFGKGISADDLQLVKAGEDVVITLLDHNRVPTGDQITILNANKDEASNIEYIQFEDDSAILKIEALLSATPDIASTENGEDAFRSLIEKMKTLLVTRIVFWLLFFISALAL